MMLDTMVLVPLAPGPRRKLVGQRPPSRSPMSLEETRIHREFGGEDTPTVLAALDELSIATVEDLVLNARVSPMSPRFYHWGCYTSC